MEDVPLCAPFEQPQVALSLQLHLPYTSAIPPLYLRHTSPIPPLYLPYTSQVVFSLQLLVCAGALHAILIGFDTVTDGEADYDGDVFGLVSGYEYDPRPPRPFALFRRDEGTGEGTEEGGGWTRVVPTGAQPGSRLLGSPVVAHAERILIFGTTDTGALP